MKRLIALLLFPLGCLAQSGSPFTNALFPAQTFTATAQTGTVIQLNGQQLSYGAGTIALTGTSLTTATFAVQGSSDNGVTFYALPITAVTPGASPAATATATASGLYQVSLVGITHVRLVTSGTFTGTSISLTLTATPNATVAHSGVSGSLSLIQLQTIASPVSSVTFSVPSTYSHLRLYVTANGTQASASLGYIGLIFNGDSAAHYHTIGTGQSGNFAVFTTASPVIGIIPGAGVSAGQVGTGVIDIPFYRQTVFGKTAVGNFLSIDGGGTSTNLYATEEWTITAAITSVTVQNNLGGNFVVGSTFSLYGIN